MILMKGKVKKKVKKVTMTEKNKEVSIVVMVDEEVPNVVVVDKEVPDMDVIDKGPLTELNEEEQGSHHKTHYQQVSKIFLSLMFPFPHQPKSLQSS